MSDQNLNIHIRGLDEFSSTFQKLNQSLSNTKNGLEDVSRSFRAMGREISQIGNAFTLLGASITAPLALAYNNAGKYSASITRQLDDMKKQWDEISISIGQSLLPVMQSLTNLIEQVVNRWNSLSQAQRDHIVQVTFLAAQYALFGGIALKVFGDVLKVFSDVFGLVAKLIGAFQTLGKTVIIIEGITAPLWAVYAVVGAIVIILAQWKDGMDYVADAVQKVYDLFAATAQLAGAVWAALNQDIDSFVAHAEKANEYMDDFLNFTPGQHGAFASTVDEMKMNVSGFIGSIKDGINTLGDFANILNGHGFGGSTNTGNAVGFWDGFLKGAEDARIKMQGVFQIGTQIATDSVKGMQSTFQSFFEDTFKGNLNNAQDYFVQFGNSLIKTFTNALAQMATNWLMFGNMFGNTGGGGGFGGIMGLLGSFAGIAGGVGSLASGFSGAGFTFAPDDGSRYSNISGNLSMPHFHSGGPIQKAHDGLGVDEVPIIAQTGEGVLSRRGMANLAKLNGGNGMSGGGVNITITPVISLWDASDVQRNSRMLIDAITQAIISNGSIRQVIKQYGS